MLRFQYLILAPLLGLLAQLAPTNASAQLEQLYAASGRIEVQTIGADVIVDDGGPGWHDSSSSGDPNDGNTFIYYDIDNSLGLTGSGATFSSSSIDYSLAAGKNIIAAFLVWGAKVDDGFNDASGVQEQVQLYVRDSTDVPNGSYIPISADGGSYAGPIGGGGSAFDLYGYHADVTQYFSGLAPGNTYKIVVADIEARLDSAILGGSAAGWTLHLVLDNPALTDDYYVTVYGGLQVVNPGETVDTSISGLNVPASTSGETYIGSSALDGDSGRPDTYSFGPAGGPLVPLFDSLHPAGDFHNSFRSYEGAYYDTNPGPIAGSSPDYDRVTHDVVQLSPNAAFNLPGSTTGATLRLTTGAGEGINLTSFALATPNNFPILSIVKEVTSVNGGPVTPVVPGDTISYTLTIQNDGTALADAVDVLVEDILPGGVTYVPGSTVAQGPAFSSSTETYLDNFDTVSYSNSNGTATWSGAWDETGDNDSPASGTISINGTGELQFLNLDGDTIERAADLSGVTSATLTFNWQEVSGDEDVGVDLWNNATASWERVGETGAGSGTFTHVLSADQISANSAIRFATGSGGWGSSERVDIDNVQFEFTTTSGPSVVVKDNNPAGNNNLVDGDPAGQLVAAADNFFLAAGASMTVTFDVTVDDAPCTTLVNNASASSEGVAASVDDTTSNDCAPDYGDAPASYGDASHGLSSALYLGGIPDAEVATQGNDATGDDDDGNDDEDGVEFTSPLGRGDNIVATITVANTTGNTVTLCGWMDVDLNGTFDVSERQCASDSASFEWFVSTTTTQNYYSRFRVCSTASECDVPSGSASDGEVEDYVVTYVPTAVTIGEVNLDSVSVWDLLTELGAAGMDRDDLLNLLNTWDAEMATESVDGSTTDILVTLADYLDPDGDGTVAVLRWDTLEERGTIGFYVERQNPNGSWDQINNEMLPGMIMAPMGAEYMLADPNAQPDNTYRYRLIELEATGSKRQYGPFSVEMP